jgi:hypothetical protein
MYGTGGWVGESKGSAGYLCIENFRLDLDLVVTTTVRVPT